MYQTAISGKNNCKISIIILVTGVKMLYNKLYTRFCKADIVLILCCMGLCGLSLYLLYTLAVSNFSHMLTSGFTRRSAMIQAIAVLIGLIAFLAILLLGERTIKRLSPAAFAVSLGLCLLTLTPLGVTVDDDRAWLSLFGVTIQPSELLKIGFIMLSALILSSHGRKRTKYLLFWACAISGGAVIFLQRDMGTLLIFMLTALGMFFCAGTSKRLWAITILLSPAFMYGAWRLLLNGDQKARIMSALDPSLDPYGVGYQQLSAKNAIAGGGFTGRLFENRGDLIYVSSAQNDFILSFAAQLFGTVGLFLICILLSIIIIRSAPRKDDEGYIYYIRSGIFTLIATQAAINTMMNLSVFPVVGIPLPFVSAGGTAAAAMLCALGLVSLAPQEKALPERVI